MNTNKTLLILILEPLRALVAKFSPAKVNLNTLSIPLNFESSSSRDWNNPIDQPLNLSTCNLSMFNWNSSKVFVVSVGIPDVPPIAKVNISLLP